MMTPGTSRPSSGLGCPTSECCQKPSHRFHSDFRRERLKSLWNRWLGFWQHSEVGQPRPEEGREVPGVIITCGGCYHKLRIPNGHVGRARCPACKREFLVRPS